MASTDLLHVLQMAGDDRSKEKSAQALRTISEAAEMLDVPAHVLRFWETRFPQIKPLKRNGGRRFYRPEDVEILQQIKHLLYRQGFTIKGAKKAIDEFAKIVGSTAQAEAEAKTGWAAPASATGSNDNHASVPKAVIGAAIVAQTPASTVTSILPTDRQLLRALREDLADLRNALNHKLNHAA